MIELVEGADSLVLEGRATRAEAAELKRLLLEQVGACKRGPRTLDLSRLEAIDVAGAQVLLAFKRSVHSDQLRLCACAPPVLAYLKSCGLAAALLES